MDSGSSSFSLRSCSIRSTIYIGEMICCFGHIWKLIKQKTTLIPAMFKIPTPELSIKSKKGVPNLNSFSTKTHIYSFNLPVLSLASCLLWLRSSRWSDCASSTSSGTWMETLNIYICKYRWLYVNIYVYMYIYIYIWLLIIY